MGGSTCRGASPRVATRAHAELPAPHLMPHTRDHAIVRLGGGGAAQPSVDRLAVEEPLEIRVGGRSLSVTMRTPGGVAEDAELAAGFLLGEGIVRSAKDIVAVRPCPDGEGNIVDVLLAPDVAMDWARCTRHVFASSSCGLCGAATIDAIRKSLPPVGAAPRVSLELLASLPARLSETQVAFRLSGGVHAAGVFAADGALLVAREDIGRHNAVDKALGRLLLDGRLPASDRILLVSGRASFEIVQKALAAGIPIVAAVSAPSSLAVDLAEESGMTLVGFLRDGRCNVYAGEDSGLSVQGSG